jgi:hypothetical protein
MTSRISSHPDDFNERLQSYLDGELDESEQKELFNQLGEDITLQSELRSMIKLESMLRSTNDTVAPQALKSSIMSTIASIPLPTGAVAQAGSTLATAATTTSANTVLEGSRIISKSVIASLPFLAGVGGALLGGLISWYALTNGVDSNSSNTITNDSNAIYRQLYASESLQLTNLRQQLSSKEQLIKQLTASLSANTTANRDLLRQLGRLNNEVRTLRSTLDDQNTRNEELVAKAEKNNSQLASALASYDGNTNGSFQPSSAQVQPASIITEKRIIEERNHVVPLLTSAQGTTVLTGTNGFQIDVRGYSMRSFPSVNVSSLVSPPLNSLALGVRWSFAKEHSVGLEIGQENVLQKYTSELNGVPFAIEQNYLAVWGGASYQYSPERIFGQDHITPFARAVVGGTQLGPMTRSVLGLNVNITPVLRLTGGAEGAVFFYQEQSNWFSTSKLGWTIGVGMGL